MDANLEAIKVIGVDHEDGDTILVELSDDRTVTLTLEELLRLEENRRAN